MKMNHQLNLILKNGDINVHLQINMLTYYIKLSINIIKKEKKQGRIKLKNCY